LRAKLIDRATEKLQRRKCAASIILVVIVFVHYNTQGMATFTLEELNGVPADVISGYTKRTEGSKEVYDVTFKTPDIFPIVCPSLISRCFLFLVFVHILYNNIVQIRSISSNS
jgi:hypothetical protein